MGAAVCCAENGGDPGDDWTTCDTDRDQLLDRSVVHLTHTCQTRPQTGESYCQVM